MVCKGYVQIEGIDFEETYAPVSRMEAICFLLAYACSKNVKVYQMDVKSTFLNGELEEEVYIEQPEGFQLSENTDYVCKLKKALYGLKQAPKAWYSRLDKYLQQARFRKGSADSNLYIKTCRMNLKCRYLENYSSFWDFRYVKATKEFLFLKPSISEKC